MIISFLGHIKGYKNLISGIVLLLNCYVGIFAQGDLMVYPTRLVFEDTQNRIQIINLSNKGKDSTTYKLSYIQNRMKEDGHLEIIEEPDSGQNFASPFLRFYPRTVTLAPNETQVVKVQLVKTGELNRGEYRSHLYFRPIPRPEALESKGEVSSEGISISLKPVYGISVANIILIEKPNVKVEITNLALEQSDKEIPVLFMDFQRSGEASSYGDLIVEHFSSTDERTVVGESKGFAVYTPGQTRKTRLKLKNVEQVNLNEGKLIVKYVSQGNIKNIIAEKILQL